MKEKIKKYWIYLALGVAAGIILAISFLTLPVEAKQDHKQWLCHCQPQKGCRSIYIDDHAVAFHLREHDEDYKGRCVEPTPTPTPKPPVCEWSEWGECEIDGVCGWGTQYRTYGGDEECKPDQEARKCEVQCEPEPSPTPTPTPTPTPVTRTSSGGGTSPAGAPTCNDSVPGGVANIYVDRGVPGDGKLEVRWLPEEPKGSKAHIRYSEVDGEWRYALLNTDNDGVEEIGDLQNGVHYWFQVAQVNGCAVGPYSQSFDPLP